MCGPVAQWIRHLTTNQGIPGSNPGGVDFFPWSEKEYQNIRREILSFEEKKRKKRIFPTAQDVISTVSINKVRRRGYEETF